MTDKPHLSATQLDMFARCGEQWRRRYVEGDKIPPGIAMAKGGGLHQAAELNMRQKIDSHVDLPASQIVDAAVAGFESIVSAEDVWLTPDERERGKKFVVSETIDALADIAEVHAAEQAPDYQPVFVEQVVEIPVASADYDIKGVIDLADDQDRLIDFKTAKRSKSQGDVDASTQLTIYAGAFRGLTGREPAEIRFDTIVQTKTKTSRQVVTTERDRGDFVALAARIQTVSKAIKAGVFLPAPAGAWQCSAAWCGFHSSCKYVKGNGK